MRYALESVVGKGRGRKAYIEGYRIGAKTGTSQIAENGVYLKGQYILSMISAFPMNDPKIAIYVAMEKPHSLIQYGGTIMGPIINNIISDVGIYLNIDKQDSELEFEYTWMDVKNYEVDNYVGKDIKEIKSKHFSFEIVGDGSKVISQLPKYKEKIKEGSKVVVFT